MADKTEHTITQESVDAFVAKLRGWAADLPIEEKAILTRMLSRAEEEPEVEGFIGGISFTPKILTRVVRGPIGDSLSPEQQRTGWSRLWGQTIPK